MEKCSIIIDCIMSGNISDLLSIDDLRTIGISIKNTDDLTLMKNYHAQEIQRISLVDISELSGKTKKHAIEYNEIIFNIKGIFKSNEE